MKLYLKAVLVTAAASVFSMATQAATVWAPADETVNIIQIPGISLRRGSLALFEDTDAAFATPLVLGSGGGVFEFTDNLDGTYSVSALVNSVPQGSALVMDGNQFMLGVSWGNGYVGDASYVTINGDPTSHNITFTDGENTGKSLAIDLTPVPLPAAAWLFGSALMGLVAVGRRKA